MYYPNPNVEWRKNLRYRGVDLSILSSIPFTELSFERFQFLPTNKNVTFFRNTTGNINNLPYQLYLFQIWQAIKLYLRPEDHLKFEKSRQLDLKDFFTESLIKNWEKLGDITNMILQSYSFYLNKWPGFFGHVIWGHLLASGTVTDIWPGISRSLINVKDMVIKSNIYQSDK